MRPSAWLRNVALALTSLALSLALAEAALRLWLPAAEVETPAPDSEALPVLHDVPELGRPNALGLYKGQVHRNNRHGFRGPEPSLTKPEGIFRIVVIGDSVTMGEGVRVEDAYAARLERILQGAGDGRFEVINLGLSGLNLRQSLDYRLRIGLKFDPDLLVYGFTVNDLEALPSYRMTRRATPSASASRLLELVRSGRRGIGERFALRGSYRAELEENYFANPAVWFEFESDLRRLALTAKIHGACVQVLLHAHLADQRAWLEPLFARIERAANEQGLHVTSSVPDFAGVDVESLWIGPFDAHPNAEGHRLLAQALARGLASLPEECWKGFRPSWEAAGSSGLSSPPASSPRSPSGSR